MTNRIRIAAVALTLTAAFTVTFRPLRDGKKGGMFVSTKTPDGRILSMMGGRDAEK